MVKVTHLVVWGLLWAGVTSLVSAQTDDLEEMAGPSVEESARPPAPPPKEAIPGVTVIDPPEQILSWNSPYLVSHEGGQVLFAGQTEHESQVMIFDALKRRFFAISPIKAGHALQPLQWNSSTREMTFALRPARGRNLWLTHAQWRGPGESPSSMGVLNTKDQTWKFFNLGWIAWLPGANLFWAANPEEFHHYVTSLDGYTRRYIAPFQSRTRSMEFFKGWSVYSGKTWHMMWIDHCDPTESSPPCLWSVPQSDKKTELPVLNSNLPELPGRGGLWHVNVAGSLMALSLWEEGSKLPTKRWWKRWRDKDWTPLVASAHLDPWSNIVIQSETRNSVSFYYLTADEKGDKATLMRMTIESGAGRKPKRAKPAVAVKLPWQTDIFPAGNSLVTISSDGIRIFDPGVVFH